MKNHTADELPKISGNVSEEEIYQRDDTPYERIFLELFTVVGILSVISNILLSFVIIKYKKMRENPTNKIFLHLNILQAIYSFATPSTFRVAMEFPDVYRMNVTVFCHTFQIEADLMFGVIWFIFLLLCDWYIKVYHKDTYAKFCRVYIFFVIYAYIAIVITSSVTLQFCYRSYLMSISELVMLVILIFIVVFIIVINIVHFIKKRRTVINHRKSNIGLVLTNISLLLWTPELIEFFLEFAGIHLKYPIITIISFLSGFASPIFNLIYLYFCDDNYHMFLKQVISCRCNTYKNENLDNTSVIYNDVEGVRIPVN